MTSEEEEEAAVPATVDTADVTEVLQDHPVRIGVLFGSTVRGTETPESDVDVAVAFEESLPSADRHRARIDLVVDLMETLGVNDVDVTDLDGVRPAVGVSALRTGAVLVGDPDRIDRLREAFESRTTDRTHDERMRALDELFARVEEAV
jgi:predicted nucleotidyltransferase